MLYNFFSSIFYHLRWGDVDTCSVYKKKTSTIELIMLIFRNVLKIQKCEFVSLLACTIGPLRWTGWLHVCRSRTYALCMGYNSITRIKYVTTRPPPHHVRFRAMNAMMNDGDDAKRDEKSAMRSQSVTILSKIYVDVRMIHRVHLHW